MKPRTIGTAAGELLLSHKTTLLAMGSAACLALAAGLQQHHIDWALVAAAALTSLAGVARSPMPAAQNPPPQN